MSDGRNTKQILLNISMWLRPPRSWTSGLGPTSLDCQNINEAVTLT